MLEKMNYVWRFEPDSQQFEQVLPRQVKEDLGAYYVIRDGYGDLWIRDPWGRECPAHFEHVEVCGMQFGREQFDPEQVDSQRADTEPSLRSLFLTRQEVEDLRAEMRRDGQWMREELIRLKSMRS
ncbi:hypothetical protein ALP73_200060 [Pseudomonas coronafaciens pv. garcae]|uniref:hypothetical protein n=1 Tax=Pseudomonas syringae group TaxID=136849 RepID=UPI000EFF0FFD|nr:hypothetical protein [Pseudomonas coronafaciens]RMS04938.1 hypothetical protein ALP73_200060 [Pseudomonas coronafaciens pv. garcae]